MTDAKLTEYTLNGKFIKLPSRGTIDAPRLVVQCAHGVGSKPGHRLASYLVVGAVLDSASAQYRLDDRKPQPGLHWEMATNFSGVFIDGPDLTSLLYGHMFKHKIDPRNPVHKVVLVMREYAAGSIIMQFDMPDPTPVAEACGILKTEH